MKVIFLIFCNILLLSSFSDLANALPVIQDKFISTYPHLKGTKLETCTTCHSPAIKNFLNVYGLDVREMKFNFKRIENLDSDNDGKSNKQEIKAILFPGNGASEDDDVFTLSNKKGDVLFDHGSHITYKSINWNCKSCHKRGGFPKRYRPHAKTYKASHRICWNCHLDFNKAVKTKKKKGTLAPVTCSGCHQNFKKDKGNSHR